MVLTLIGILCSYQKYIFQKIQKEFTIPYTDMTLLL